MNKKHAAMVIIGLAVLFIGTMAIRTIDSVYASRKDTGTGNQQNSCGNDDLTMNIICQNNNSKDHGRDNAVFVNSTHPH